ncbi:MAG: hypothetical protein WD231_04425 [Candidatus Woykebacteria bacterium]
MKIKIEPRVVTAEDFGMLFWENIVPDNRKYTDVRKMLTLFSKNGLRADNYLLAQCIEPTVKLTRKKRFKLTKGYYEDNDKKYKSQIRNRFRTINRLIGPKKFARFHSGYSEIITRSKQK